ncbi:C-type lectin domain family 1 member B [Microcaecilia unicolor]|uniref:C-type lectin domain family 1 member B-like n=1 Tax=Microcaecilia unicolor TaxID=1415580 RepID=A0A6P7WX87_9AMPH|nr:C-type lectin domain family 1 member B-like [Microcaecilia unicolor]
MEDEDGYTSLSFKGRGKTAQKEPPRAEGWKIFSIILGVVLLLQAGAWIVLLILKIPVNCSGLIKTCQCSNLSHQEDQLLLEKIQDYLCGEVKEGSPCDFCPYSWLLSHARCYYFSEEERDWNYSLEYCKSRSSQLLTLYRDSEMELMDRKGDDFFWLGLQYNHSKGKWVWLSNSTVRKASIGMSTTDSMGSCGIYRSGKVHATQCHSFHRWICEKNAARFDTRGGNYRSLET